MLPEKAWASLKTLQPNDHSLAESRPDTRGEKVKVTRVLTTIFIDRSICHERFSLREALSDPADEFKLIWTRCMRPVSSHLVLRFSGQYSTSNQQCFFKRAPKPHGMDKPVCLEMIHHKMILVFQVETASVIVDVLLPSLPSLAVLLSCMPHIHASQNLYQGSVALSVYSVCPLHLQGLVQYIYVIHSLC